MKVFRLETLCNVYYLNADNIFYIETPTARGKPVGWPDGFAALVEFRETPKGERSVYLTAEQWRQLQITLGLEHDKPIIVPTGAKYEAIPVEKQQFQVMAKTRR